MTFNYDFQQLRDAVQECTSYDLIEVFDDITDEYVLIDAFGDQDGDPFPDLDSVYDYITNNEDIQVYLDALGVLKGWDAVTA